MPTVVYRFDAEGKIKEILRQTPKDTEVRIWKPFPSAPIVNYTVSRDRKVLYAESLVIGEVPFCPFCHREVNEKGVKLGVFTFHRGCHAQFAEWWRRNK